MPPEILDYVVVHELALKNKRPQTSQLTHNLEVRLYEKEENYYSDDLYSCVTDCYWCR